MTMHEVTLRNATDDELLSLVDRSNVEVAALCRIVERGDDGEFESLRIEIRDLENDVERVGSELDESEASYNKLASTLHEKYPAIAKELGV